MVLGMFTILLFTKLRADLVFVGSASILYLTGVLSEQEAFSGISSNSVIVIGVLFVVVAGLTHTGVLQWIVRNLLGQPEGYSKAVIRLMLPVASLIAATFFTLWPSHAAVSGRIFEPVLEGTL